MLNIRLQVKFIISTILLFLFSSDFYGQNIEEFNNSTIELHDSHELFRPDTEAKYTLILFGGFPENVSDIKREFKIISEANKNEIAIIFLNFNKALWIDEEDKKKLNETIQEIILNYNLPDEKIYLGGFSSGGNIALLLSNYLFEVDSQIRPSGVFIIDSPVDLLKLHELCQKNIKLKHSALSVNESKYLVNFMENELGDPALNREKYIKYSPYFSEDSNIENVENLAKIKVRFYSEPDVQWWKENRSNDVTDLNANWIQRLANDLKKESKKETIEYIQTINKGYRANGERHPHSWSIVDIPNLIHWIKR